MARARHAYTDPARGTRLQRVLADAGVASRRHCEALIESGVVTVNGDVVDTLPAWVDASQDRIEVNGQPIRRRREQLIYVMLYKPRGTVSTNRDPEGRPRAIDLVEHPSGVRLYPVGRLDLDSSGLLLLTNDGELANRLTHPRYEVHKGYEVMVSGRLEPEDVARLEAGIFLPERGQRGRRTERSRLTVLRRERDRTLLFMELHEGRNRQIRRMMLRLGHPVKKLCRVQMGPLRLKGLAVGEWRDLTPGEISALHRAANAMAEATAGEASPPRRGASSGGRRTDRQSSGAARSGDRRSGSAGSRTTMNNSSSSGRKKSDPRRAGAGRTDGARTGGAGRATTRTSTGRDAGPRASRGSSGRASTTRAARNERPRRSSRS